MLEKSPKFPSDPRKEEIKMFGSKWELTTPNRDSAETWALSLVLKLKEAGIPLKKDSKILEIGSGQGILLNVLKEKGYAVVGVDAFPRAEANPPQVAARIEQLPFPDNTFDVVLGVAVFDSHVYSQEQDLMIQEIKRVLKSGGVFTGFGNNPHDFSQLRFNGLTPISTAPELDERLYRKE